MIKYDRTLLDGDDDEGNMPHIQDLPGIACASIIFESISRASTLPWSNRSRHSLYGVDNDD